MAKNGRTFREDVRIIKRGLKEFEYMLHGQMRHIYFRGILVACIAYVPGIMSAAIIEELVGSQKILKLMILSIWAALIMFILSIMKILEDKKIAIGYSYLFSAHEIYLTNKAYKLPFESVESNKVRELRDKVSGSINVSGAGMASLYWDMDVLFTNLCSAMIAVVLCFFFVKDIVLWDYLTSGGIVKSVYLVLGLIILVTVSSIVSCKMTSKRFDVNYEVFVNGAKYNRYGEFYTISYLSDETAALDTRIYAQTETIVNECQNKCYARFAEGKRKEIKAVNRYDGMKLLCTCLCGGAVYLLIAGQAATGAVSIGNIIIIYSAVTKLIDSLARIAEIVTDLQNNNIHLLNFFAYMDMENMSEAEESDKFEKAEAGGVESIEFRNVSFKYPESQQYVLNNINLKISKGDKVAFVGENGSGKTTLIKLLCRLYRPTKGEILLNGRNIEEYSTSEYIKNLSAVFQDYSLFAFPVAENVAASKIFDENRVWDCLRSVGLDKKISSYPKGIYQPLFHSFEEEGVDLSGGESQKLAIARAIYKDAEIMILDEPTSALDPLAEDEIFRKFYEITDGKTALFISHRLSSCRMADYIIVLDKGCIVQSGKHEALVADKEGKYCDMWSSQSFYYASEGKF